jgi:hypothetical protein
MTLKEIETYQSMSLGLMLLDITVYYKEVQGEGESE